MFGVFSVKKGGECMSGKNIDPRNQFSKWLARWTAIFWAVYLSWLSVIMLIHPETSVNVVYLGLMTTGVMLLNVWAYTRNSTYEKGLLAMLDKVRIQFGSKEAEPEQPEAEGGDNG